MKKPNEFVTWKSYVLPVAIVAIGLYVFIQTEETIRFIAIAIGLATILKGIGTIFLKDSPVQNPRYKIFGVISIVIGVSIIILSEDIGALFSYYIAAILVYHAIIDFLIYLDLGKFIDSAGSSDTITITRD